jgi:hypothetical protein
VSNAETFTDDSVYNEMTLKKLFPLSKGDVATSICISIMQVLNHQESIRREVKPFINTF